MTSATLSVEWSTVTWIDEVELAHRGCVLCAADEDHVVPLGPQPPAM